MNKRICTHAILCLSALVLVVFGMWLVQKSASKSEYDQFLFRYTGAVFSLDPIKERVYAREVSDACGRQAASMPCWQSLINTVLKEKGSEEAFGIVTYLSNTEPAFQENCEPLLYGLGQDAYETFKDGRHVFATIRTKYCGYSFFSGVLDSLTMDKESGKTASNFCTVFDAALTPQEALFSSCLHGFGEAAVFLRAQKDFPSPEDLVRPGISTCQKITETEADMEDCSGGAFNALATLYRKHVPGLVFNMANPLHICNEEKELSWERPCYRMFKYLLMEAGGGDFVRASAFIEQTNNDVLAASAVYDLSSLAVRQFLTNGDDMSLARDCQRLEERVQTSCAEGAAAGLMTHGAFDKEYVRALRFCSLSSLGEAEKAGCYGQVAWMSSLRYPSASFGQICALIPAAYRNGKAVCA